MKVINPTKDTIKVQIKGTEYVIEPESSLVNVPNEIAKYWKENIHTFIGIELEDNVTFVETKTEEDSETNNVEESTEADESTEIEEDSETDVAEDADGEEEDVAKQLDTMNRKDLDEVAEGLGLNPEDYQTKGEIKEAIKNSK